MKRQSMKQKNGRAGRIIALLSMIFLLLGVMGVFYQCAGRDDPVPTPEEPSFEFELNEYHFIA